MQTLNSSVPSWDQTAMEIVEVFAKRAHCVSRQYNIGACFFRGKNLIAVGYNGPPKGQPHCDEVGCAKMINGKMTPAGSGLCRGAHAEMNAIVNAAREGICLKDARLYCTFSPCYDCAKHLVNLGITEIVYKIKYDQHEGLRAFDLLAKAGIIIRQFK